MIAEWKERYARLEYETSLFPIAELALLNSIYDYFRDYVAPKDGTGIGGTLAA